MSNNSVNSVNPKAVAKGIPNQVLSKICTKCNEEKPIGRFSPKYGKVLLDGTIPLQGQCMDCRNKYHQEYRSRDREKYRQKSLDRYYEKTKSKEYLKLLCDRKKIRDEINKHDAFVNYGGYVCACCGETEKSFLSIDHINNDGNIMRLVHGHSGKFYAWLKRNNYPSGFQILCMNCQWGKLRNNGVCPHQERRNDYPNKREYTQAGGSALHLVKGDDIVCSAGKPAAALKERV